MSSDSSGGSLQSIAKSRDHSSITHPKSATPTAFASRARETRTPTSGSRAAPEGSGGAGDKVWIPRMSHRPGPVNRARTKHACEACRRRRIKCDGLRPVCQGCAIAGTDCLYADHKRVRDRQELRSLKTTIDQYEHLLRDLLQEVPAGAAKRIQLTLTPTDPYRISRNPSMSSSSSSSPGSTEGIDTISEDLNRNEESRATGFIGKNSVHAWLRNLEPDSGYRVSPDRSTEGAGGTRISQPISPQGLENNLSVSYFLDDQKLPLSNSFDAYKMPSKNVADCILHSYFKSVQPLFPIVRTDLFLEQYRSIWGGNSGPRPGQKWLAIFNMILAIGCRRLQFLQEKLPPGTSHETFFSRARSLSLNENMPFEHGGLQQVQVEALVTLYFMVSMQINRAWKVSGIAVRSAMALAINLRITDTDLQPGSKEARSRLWWSIYMLEVVLSHMTGRPTCIGSSSFSVEQPIPYSEDMFVRPHVMELLTTEGLRKERLRWSLDEQENENDDYDASWLREIEPNQGLQFYHLIDLMHIVHIAIGELYSPKGFQANKSYIKRRIRFYDERLDHWLSRLPPACRFVDQSGNQSLRTLSQEQTVLALHYYGARINIYRPCSPFRGYAGLKEKEYAYIGQRCLQAALSMIAVFPDSPDLDWVYNTSPWWCILHFLMQASTMLAIFIQSSDTVGSTATKDAEYSFAAPGEAAQVQAACQKAHRWLRGLSRVDESCRRAFVIYDDVLRRLGFVMSSSSATSISGSARSNPLSRKPSSSQTAQQEGSDQPAYNVQQGHGEYSPQMAVDSSLDGMYLDGFAPPMPDTGDIQSPLDWGNVDTSAGAISAEPDYTADIAGESEWLGTVNDENNVRMKIF